jgi:hypothetical protein
LPIPAFKSKIGGIFFGAIRSRGLADAFSLITFDDGDFPVELHSAVDCVRAVKSGSITAETRIIVYQEDGERVRMKAGEFGLFKELLGIDATPESALPEVEVPEAVASTPPPEPLKPVASAAAPAPIPPPLTYANEEPAPAPTVPITQRGWFLPVLLAVLLSILWLYRSADAPADTATDAAAAGDATAAADPEAGLIEQSFYTMREVNVQPRPTAGAGVGKVARGTELSGVIVSGAINAERWLKIRKGTNTGLYVWAGNLSGTVRPELDSSVSGPKSVILDVPVRTEPNLNASIASGKTTSLSIGETVNVAGLVADGWAELTLKTGGIGYVPADSLALESDDLVGDVVDAAADAANAAISAVGASGGHKLYVQNQCPYPITLALYYRNAEGWQNNNGALWKFGANKSAHPSWRGADLIAVSRPVYYRITEANGDKINNFTGDLDVTYGTQTLSMKRANVDEAANGDYQIAFTC